MLSDLQNEMVDVPLWVRDSKEASWIFQQPQDCKAWQRPLEDVRVEIKNNKAEGDRNKTREQGWQKMLHRHQGSEKHTVSTSVFGILILVPSKPIKSFKTVIVWKSVGTLFLMLEHMQRLFKALESKRIVVQTG